MNIVLNKCYGGFGLSYEGMMLYAKLKGIKLYPYTRKTNPDGSYPKKDEWVEYKPPMKINLYIMYFTKQVEDINTHKWEHGDTLSDRDIERNDGCLVEVVKRLGKKANGECADLRIVEIPDDVEYEIEEYDGIETAEEPHRSW